MPALFFTAAVKNKTGKFVAPSLATTTAAGVGVKVPADLGLSIIDSPNPTAYPIASQTFVILYKDACKAGKSKQTATALKQFVDYALGDGQNVLSQLQYGKLPPALLSQAKSAAGTLQCNGKAL